MPVIQPWNDSARRGQDPDNADAELATQISQLDIHTKTPATSGSPPQPVSSAKTHQGVSSQHQIAEFGPPADVLFACPEIRPVSHSLPWYSLQSLEQATQSSPIRYLICTKCHADYIRDSPLANLFVRLEQPGCLVTFCCFSLPRIKDILWPRTLSSKKVDAISSFMRERATINPCRDADPVPSGYTTWLGLMNGEIDGFRVCHACYVDRIVDTAFQGKFGVYPDDADTDQWTCHVGSALYIAQSLSIMLKRTTGLASSAMCVAG